DRRALMAAPSITSSSTYSTPMLSMQRGDMTRQAVWLYADMRRHATAPGPARVTQEQTARRGAEAMAAPARPVAAHVPGRRGRGKYEAGTAAPLDALKLVAVVKRL